MDYKVGMDKIVHFGIGGIAVHIAFILGLTINELLK